MRLHVNPARYSCEGFDSMVHKKARLGNSVFLADHQKRLIFPGLNHMCGFVCGNSGRHLQVNENPGPEPIHKDSRRSRRPKIHRMSVNGYRALRGYSSAIKLIVRNTEIMLEIPGVAPNTFKPHSA